LPDVGIIARNAQKYGGAVLVIGGLIGENINRENYRGDFEETPIFIGTSNPDFHVPIERVYATENILKQMNADVTLKYMITLVIPLIGMKLRWQIKSFSNENNQDLQRHKWGFPFRRIRNHISRQRRHRLFV